MFTLVRGGCDNHRCHNKNPGSDGPGFLVILKKSSLLRFGPGQVQLGLQDLPRVCWVSELRFEAGRSESSLWPTGCAACCWVRWNSQHSKKLCLSLLVSKT